MISNMPVGVEIDDMNTSDGSDIDLVKIISDIDMSDFRAYRL